MRLNKVKKIFANRRRSKAKTIPEWVYKKTDRKVKVARIKYTWRQQKLKV